MTLAVAAASRLKALQSQSGNKICVDCDQKNPQWASVSFGIFMCLECAGKHRSLGVHISFVRSVSMDSWSEVQLERMEASGGNGALNSFLLEHGIPKETDIVSKYNSKAAAVYRKKVQVLAEGKEWKETEVVQKESVGGKESSKSGSDGEERRIAKMGFVSDGVGSSRKDGYGNSECDGYGYSDWGSRNGGKRGSQKGARYETMGNSDWRSDGRDDDRDYCNEDETLLGSHSHGAGFDEAPLADIVDDLKNLMQVSWRFMQKFLLA